MITVNTEQAELCLTDCIKAKVMPMLTGSPGIGKSAVVQKIAKKFNLKLIDIRLSQCDPCDLLGFPDIDRVANKASYVPMDMFPLEGDEIPEGYDGWLLFMDELNSADKAVQKASYKVILDRMIGNQNMHAKVAIIGAGNKATDNAIVEEMSTALQSRMVHYELGLDFKTWLRWAMDNGIDHRITSYIQFKPNMLHTFKPDHSDVTYACPRTWEFANGFMSVRDVTDPLTRINLSGTLSESVAREFIAFCSIYKDLPTIAQIIADPAELNVPNEASILYALTGSIAAHSNKDNIDDLMKFITRMPPEFQIICVREVIRRDSEINDAESINDWVTNNRREFW